MKALFDATVLQQPPTGIGKTTMRLYEHVLKVSEDMKVIAVHQKNVSTQFPSDIYSLQKGKWLPESVWRNRFLSSLIASQKPSFIHFPWNGNVPKISDEITVVTTLHDVLPLSIPQYFASSNDEFKYRNRVQRDIDRSHLLITDSEYSKLQIIKNFNVKKDPIVLYLASTIVANEVEIQNKPEYFLYVGGYDARKGLESLTQVFLRLHRDKLLSSKLVFTGVKHYFSKKFKDLMEEGRNLGIIEELGYVADEELTNLIHNAKALVYPSKYEGFGLPPLEAMALECPVITTNFTSIPEICGNAAVYVDPDNDRNFAEGLISLETNSELRTRLKIMGKKQAEKFSWHRTSEIFLSEVKNIISNRKSREINDTNL